MPKVQVCSHCGHRFARLDRHLAGRHACGRAAAAGRLGKPPTSPAGDTERADRADRAVMQEGEWARDRYGNARAHPAIAVARAARLAMSRLLTALNLDADEEAS